MEAESPRILHPNRVESPLDFSGPPPALADYLAEHCGLSPVSLVLDVEAGPGRLSRHFLERRCSVVAVEPDAALRACARRQLEGYEFYQGLHGEARATGLAPGRASFVVSGQPGAWYAKRAAQQELRRVLAPGGWLCLYWNLPRELGDPFFRHYLRIVRDYSPLPAREAALTVDENRLDALFAPKGFRVVAFNNQCPFSWEDLALASLRLPQAPPPGSAARRRMLGHLRAVFDEFQEGGLLRARYRCLLYFGRCG